MAKLQSKLVKDLFGVASLQILQILLSALIGFLLIRFLTKEEYAIFNLFTTASATILAIAAMSTTVLFIPFANKFGLDKLTLQKSTIIYRILNQPMVYIGVGIGLVNCFVSANTNHWIDIDFAIVTILLLLVFRNQYVNRFYESYFKLLSEPLRPFTANFMGELLRLFLIFIATYFFKSYFSHPIIFLFLFLLLSTTVSNYLLKRNAAFNIGEKIPYTQEQKKLYWSNFKPLLFPSFFFQIMQLFRNSLIYFVTGSSVIAEAAALGRLMMLFAAMDKVVEMVIIPRLGKQQQGNLFIKGLLLSVVIIAFIGCILVISAYYYPNLWLWLLGEKYANVKVALMWAIATAVIERISGLIMFAQLAKGRTKGQWWIPIVATFSYYLFFYFNGIGSAEDATKALMVSACINLLAQVCIFLYIMKRKEGNSL